MSPNVENLFRVEPKKKVIPLLFKQQLFIYSRILVDFLLAFFFNLVPKQWEVIFKPISCYYCIESVRLFFVNTFYAILLLPLIFF